VAEVTTDVRHAGVSHLVDEHREIALGNLQDDGAGGIGMSGFRAHVRLRAGDKSTVGRGESVSCVNVD